VIEQIIDTPLLVEVQEAGFGDGALVRRVLPGAHAGIIRAGDHSEAFGRDIGVGGIELGRLQNAVDFIKELEEGILITVTVGNVLDEV